MDNRTPFPISPLTPIQSPRRLFTGLPSGLMPPSGLELPSGEETNPIFVLLSIALIIGFCYFIYTFWELRSLWKDLAPHWGSWATGPRPKGKKIKKPEEKKLNV